MPVEREITTPDLEIEQAPGVNIDVEQPLTNGNAMMLEDGSAIVNPMEEQPNVKIIMPIWRKWWMSRIYDQSQRT